MVTTSDEPCLYSATQWNPNLDIGFTVEAQVKLNEYYGSESLGGMALWAGSTTSEAILLITPTEIKEYGSGKSYSMNTTDNFHIYRITVLGNTYTVYVDSIQVLTGTTDSWDRNVMYFGDGSYGAGGDAQWSCIAYTTSGAFNPSELFSPSCVEELYCNQPKSYYDTIILGTDSAEILIGTNQNDLILGFGGDDFLKGKAGDDCIYGGDGNDTILADRGNDIIYGGDGNDVIMGQRGIDVIDAGNGSDICVGIKKDITQFCEITS